MALSARSLARGGLRLVNVAVSFLLALVVVGFSVGSYRWAFKVNRMKSQAINPVMYPSFTYVNTSGLCCSREPYFHLWRTFDWGADGYTHDRTAGEFLRVPVMYVHGNGGSYFCARSFARFIYEANVRQRRASLLQFDTNVKQEIFGRMRGNSSLRAPAVGERFPAWLVESAEESVLRERTPMLGAEVFSVDFLEESYAQSAVLTVKEARFLNHSMHFVMDRFLRTYEELLQSDAALRCETPAPATEYPLTRVEDEYLKSLGRYSSTQGSPVAYEIAQDQLRRFSTAARVRLEVQRVRERGLWVWSESLGGTVALLAAVMQPTLYAGIVLVGSPTHYPPLFFDTASAWLYKIISDASIRHYPQQPSPTGSRVYDWERDVLPHTTPLGLIRQIGALPSEAVAARTANITLLAINGGALDDIIPSVSAYLHRSTPRSAGFYTGERLAALRKTDVRFGAFRRDLSTEVMRGVGLPMDHRGLVYGLQFLNSSADSFVQAALLPGADSYLAAEAHLPSLGRDRLFPSVTETLPTERYAAQEEQLLFVRSVERRAETADANTDDHRGHRRSSLVKALAEEDVALLQMEEVCVDNGGQTVRIADLPSATEDAALLFDSVGPLHLLLGYTTYAPDEVHLPRLELFDDAARTAPHTASDVHVRPATKLHLPFMRKDTRKAMPGRTLSTVISFQVVRTPDAGRGAVEREQESSAVVYARFCFQVDKAAAGSAATRSKKQRSYFLYDVIDPSTIMAAAQPRYLGHHYVGNKPLVEAHDGYSLVTGIDSATQETRMSVRISSKSEVYPFVLAGNLRSFYITARGNTDIPADDPDDQMQYFFGPFVRRVYEYNYSWKAFSTYRGDLNDTYLVYVLADNSVERPSVLLHDLSESQVAASAGPWSSVQWSWWTKQWPERWLAFFSAFSGIGKLGGAYVLLFFMYFVCAGEIERWATGNPIMRAWWTSSTWRRVFFVSPLFFVLVSTALEEFVFGSWAEFALRVCLERDPPPLLSEAEMTARMGWLEKLTLVFLYGMKPNYRNCQYTWVSMQSVPVWSSFLEHLATIYFGFVLSAFMLFLIFTYVGACFIASSPVHYILRTRQLFRFPTAAKAVFVLYWALPNLSWIVFPNLPLAYRHLATVTHLVLMFRMLPLVSQPAYSHPLVLSLLAVACTFPAHFDGAVLTVRNHIMMRRSPEAFWDNERNANVTGYQILVWCIMEGVYAVIYATIYLIALHEYNYREAQQRKARERDGKPNTSSKPEDEKAVSDTNPYVLGEMKRTHPTLHRCASAGIVFFGVASAWVTVIVLRRPLEGGVILVGNMSLLLLLGCTLVSKW